MDELPCANPRCDRMVPRDHKYCDRKCMSEATGYRRDAVLARLREGPASVEDLAVAIWGESYAWPEHWQVSIGNAIHALRKTISIKTRPVSYALADPPPTGDDDGEGHP